MADLSIKQGLQALSAQGLRWRLEHRNHGFIEASYPDWEGAPLQATGKILCRDLTAAISWLEGASGLVPEDQKSKMD